MPVLTRGTFSESLRSVFAVVDMNNRFAARLGTSLEELSTGNDYPT